MARKKQYELDNKEKIQGYQKEYYSQNKEKIAAQKKQRRKEADPMKYKCNITDKSTNIEYQSEWKDTEADARRECWEKTGKKKDNFSTISRSRYTLKVEKKLKVSLNESED